MGRPTDLTPEVANGIILAIRTGVPMKVAAESQGIGASTLHEWRQRGEGTHPERDDPQGIYADFADRVTKAKAEAHILSVGTIRRAINAGSWQAAVAWIKLRYPEHYAERMEHSGPGGSPIALEIAQALEGLTEEELASIERHLATQGSPPKPGRSRKGAKG